MMYTNDENSSARKKGKRRSSILKMPKSPGLALDDIDPNTQNLDDTIDVKSKKSRRSASRRVSFAETCQIKEIPNEVLKRAQFEIDENTSAHLVLELGNTCDESTYREPATTLAGLSSLLSSPIQDSPEKQRFHETNERCSDAADTTTALDFTCVGFKADTSLNQLNMIGNQMDMTISTGRLIHEDVPGDQTTEMSFYQAETPKNLHRQPLQKLNRSPEQGDDLDFTCHGGNIQGEINGDMTNNKMEMTRNYDQWELQKSYMPTPHSTTSGVNSEDLDFTCHGSNIEGVINGDMTNNKMEMTRNYDQWELQKSYMPTPHSTTSGVNSEKISLQRSARSSEQGDNLDLTRCNAGNIENTQCKPVDQDITGNQMELTMKYDEQWEKSYLETPLSSTLLLDVNAEQALQFPERSPEEGESLDLTCQGNDIQKRGMNDEAITSDQMDMTGNYQQWELGKSSMVSPHSTTSRMDNNRSLGHSGQSPEQGDNLDFTCQGSNMHDNQDVSSNQMDMTRNYEKWELEKSSSATPHSTISKENNVQSLQRSQVMLPRTIVVERPFFKKVECPKINPLAFLNELKTDRKISKKDTKFVLHDPNTPKTDKDQAEDTLPSSSRGEGLLFGKLESPKMNGSAFLNKLRGNGAKIVPSVSVEGSKINRSAFLNDFKANDTKIVSSVSVENSKINGSAFLNDFKANDTKIVSSISVEKRKINRSAFLNDFKASDAKIVSSVSVENSKINDSAFLNDFKANDAKIASMEDRKSDSRGRDLAATRGQSDIVDYQDADMKTLECQKLNGSAFLNEIKTNDADVVSMEDSQINLLISGQDMATTGCQSDIVNCQDIEMKQAQVPGIVLTPNAVDLVQSQIIPVCKRNLSVISEESAVEQSMNQKKDENQKQSKNDKDPDEDEKPYTYKEFRVMGHVTFMRHVINRSETPIIEDAQPSEMKDIIYKKCLREAKFDIWHNNFEQFQAEIRTNERLLSLKEEELNKSNPAIFGKLKRAVAMGTQDSIEKRIMLLKRACNFSVFSKWYDRQTEIVEQVLSSLKNKKEILSNDESLLQNRENELDDDSLEVDKLIMVLEAKNQDLEVTLDSEEKKWDAYKKKTDEFKRQLEGFELELQTKESQREYLASEKNTISCQIADQKNKKTELENNIQKLSEDMAYADLNLKEMKKNLPYLEGIQEWSLTEHDANSLKFTFLCSTFDLEVSYEEQEDSSLPAKTKHISLISQLSDRSIPLAKLAHQLIVQKFSQNDFLIMFPTRDRLPQLLHLVSEAIARAWALIADVQTIAINHIVLLNGKILTIEFSSLANFIKFELNFDLNKLVTDGVLPYTVVTKIGTTR